jgi:hypothetical protein
MFHVERASIDVPRGTYEGVPEVHSFLHSQPAKAICIAEGFPVL